MRYAAGKALSIRLQPSLSITFTLHPAVVNSNVLVTSVSVTLACQYVGHALVKLFSALDRSIQLSETWSAIIIDIRASHGMNDNA